MDDEKHHKNLHTKLSPKQSHYMEIIEKTNSGLYQELLVLYQKSSKGDQSPYKRVQNHNQPKIPDEPNKATSLVSKGVGKDERTPLLPSGPPKHSKRPPMSSAPSPSPITKPTLPTPVPPKPQQSGAPPTERSKVSPEPFSGKNVGVAVRKIIS